MFINIYQNIIRDIGLHFSKGGKKANGQGRSQDLEQGG